MDLAIVEQLMQLKPIDSRCAETSLPLHSRGVSLEWLRDALLAVADYLGADVEAQWAMYQGAELRFAENPMSEPTASAAMTPANLVQSLIKPLTHTLQGSLFSRVSDKYLGEPQQFISHSWRSPLVGGYGTLENLTGYGWIDVVCYNQHVVENVAVNMRSVIATIPRWTLPLGLTAEPLTRVWCLWELVCAHLENKELHVSEMLTGATDIGAVWHGFDRWFTSIADAGATLERDREQILAAFVSTFGSIGASDAFVRDAIKNRLRKPRWLA